MFAPRFAGPPLCGPEKRSRPAKASHRGVLPAQLQPGTQSDEMANADIRQVMTSRAPARTKLQLVKAASSHLRSVQKQPKHIRRYFQLHSVKYAAQFKFMNAGSIAVKIDLIALHSRGCRRDESVHSPLAPRRGQPREKLHRSGLWDGISTTEMTPQLTNGSFWSRAAASIDRVILRTSALLCVICARSKMVASACRLRPRRSSSLPCSS